MQASHSFCSLWVLLLEELADNQARAAGTQAVAQGLHQFPLTIFMPWARLSALLSSMQHLVLCIPASVKGAKCPKGMSGVRSPTATRLSLLSC